MKQFIRSYWKSIVIVTVIAYFSLLRESRIPLLPPIANADKWAHICMYLVLAFALQWETGKAKISHIRQWEWSLLFPIAYGGIIELLQHYFFYPRTGDWLDWTADIIGTIIGIGLGILIMKISAKARKKKEK